MTSHVTDNGARPSTTLKFLYAAQNSCKVPMIRHFRIPIVKGDLWLA